MSKIITVIKEKLAAALKMSNEIFKDYKLTLLLILIWTITGMFEDSYYHSELTESMEIIVDKIEDVMYFVFRCATMIGFWTFFLELRYQNTKKKLLLCIPVTLLSGALIGMNMYGSYRMEEMAMHYMVGYYLIMVLLIVYAAYCKYGRNFAEYLSQMVVCMFAVVCISFVALIGFGIVHGAITSLLLANSDYFLGNATVFLVVGLVFWPGCIWALQSHGSSESEWLREVLIILMTGFSVCATVVIYFYALKIIVTGSTPSNEVYSVMANLFAFSVPVWLFCSGNERQGVWNRILGYLPCIYAPLILLQIYSMGVRIMQYGLTPERYAGVMLILFEAVAVYVCTFKKSYCDKLLLFGAGMIFTAVFLPFVNMYHLSAVNQKGILNGYVERMQAGEVLTEKEVDRMESAYEVLRKLYGKDFVEALYSDEAVFETGNVINIITAESEKYQKKYNNIHGCQLVGEVDTEGYSAMNMLNQNEAYDLDEEEGGIRPDFTAFQFYKRETGEEVVIDLSGFAEKCFAYKQEHPDSNKGEESDYLKEFNRIEVDENTVFYVNHFEVSYYTAGEDYENMEITNVNISGMLLENK